MTNIRNLTTKGVHFLRLISFRYITMALSIVLYKVIRVIVFSSMESTRVHFVTLFCFTELNTKVK